MSKDKSYRIRANVGNETEKVLYVNLEQTYDSLDILSLKINQTNAYKLYQSNYGVIVGRVYANGGFGVPNAKISVFIETTEEWGTVMNTLYPYASVTSVDNKGIRYNLLLDEVDDACHQDVGTFPNKRYVLDNNDIIEVFEKYYKYTTTTNSAGDYMLFGVPTGAQTIHMDVDLSDVGILSQRPRDMIYKGYNITMFESPNKFKTDTNIDSLPQIQSQDTSAFVYPYWGDTSDTSDSSDLIAVTRCDIALKYKFEPTCIFMGSVVTSTGTDAINKDCSSSLHLGRMENLVTGEGTIEMIRKRFDNKVEQFSIEGNRLIDSDGVWCYQIPMNLDYIITDEFGNIVPSDNPDKGIPTRTRVRFRISLDDIVNDEKARNRCKYLVPNNPHLDEENYPYFTEQYKSAPVSDDGVDYEFGTKTKDENFRDLFWNKVYTVKNFIPRIQKGTYGKNNRKFCGIKMVNHHGDNNPMPFNNVAIKLGFTYKLLCFIIKLIINLISFLNNLITIIAIIPCILYKFFNGCSKIWLIGAICKPFRNAFKAAIPSCVSLDSEFCNDEVTHKYTYYPGCGKFLGASLGSWAGCVAEITRERHNKKQVNGVPIEDRTVAVFETGELMNCVENALAEEHDGISLNFTNDWINGCLFMPMWFRKITPKKKFLFWTIHRAKDQHCSYTTLYGGVYTLSTCALNKRHNISYDSIYSTKGKETAYVINGSDSGLCTNKNRDCDKAKAYMRIPTGIVVSKTTIDEKTVYYYKAASTLYTEDESKTVFGRLFATDIVLLGSLNECDMDGIPQFFKSLESTTYNEPSNLLVASTDISVDYQSDFDEDEEPTAYNYLTSHTEAENESNKQRGPVNISLNATAVSEQTGKDWGNTNDDLCNGGKTITAGAGAGNNDDGGLFYGIGCSDTDVRPKSCINLSRICEYGVTLDASSLIETESEDVGDGAVIDGTDITTERLSPDGYISKDDIYDDDGRTAFATMNGNGLKTVIDNTTGLRKYVFKTLIVDNFDGSLREIMKKTQTSCTQSPKYNYYLETFSDGYYDFRMGTGINNLEGSPNKNNHFYDYNNKFPIYENSFYFYFGLNVGNTAIEKFNSIYFSECSDAEDTEKVDFTIKARAWCSTIKEFEDEGYVTFNLSEVEIPCDISLSPMSNAESDQVTYKINQVQHEKIYVSQTRHNELEKKGYVKMEIESVSSESSQTSTYIPNGTYTMSVEDADGNFYEDILDINPPSMKCTTVKTNFVNSTEELLEIYGDYERIIAENKLVVNDDSDEFTVNTTREIGGTIALATPIDGLNDSKIKNYVVTLELLGDLNVETISYSNNREVKYWRQISKADYNWLQVENEDITTNVVGDKVYKISANDDGNERTEVKLAIEDESDEDNNTYYVPITREENDSLNARQYTASITVHEGCFVEGDVDKIMVSKGVDTDNGDVVGDAPAVGDAVDVIIFKLPKDNEQYLLTVSELCEDDNGTYIECGNIYTERFVVTVKQPFKLIINETIDYDVIKDWACGFKVNGTGKARTIVQDSTNSVSSKWWHMSDSKNYSWDKYSGYQDLDGQIIEMLMAIKNSINSLKDDDDALYEVYDVVLSYLYKTDANVKTFVDNMVDNVGRYGQDGEETVGAVETFLYNRKDSTGTTNIEIDIDAAKLAVQKINDTLQSARYQINSIISKQDYNDLPNDNERAKYRPITYALIGDDNEQITADEFDNLPELCANEYALNKSVECLWTTGNGELTLDEQAEYHVYCYQTQDGKIFTNKDSGDDIYITYYSNGRATSSIDDVSINPWPIDDETTKGSIKLPYSYFYEPEDLTLNWFDYLNYRCQSDFEPFEYINVDTFKVTVFVNQEWKDSNNVTYSGYYFVLNEFITNDMVNVNNFKLLSDGSTRYYVTYINGETSLPVDWDDKWYITADGKDPINTVDNIVDINKTIIALLDMVPEIKNSFIVDMKNAFMITCKGQNKMMTFSALTDDKPVEYNVVYRNEVLPEDVEDPEFNVLEPKDTIIDVNGSMIDNITIPTIINVNNKSYGNTLHKITESGDRLCFARDNYFKTPSSTATDKYWKKAYFIGLKNRVGDTIPRGERTDTSLKYFGFHIIGKPLDIQSISWANIRGIPYFNVTDNRVGNTVTMSGLLSGNIYNGIITSNKDENGKNMTFFEEQLVGAATLKIYTPIPDGFNKETIEDDIPTTRYIVGIYSLDRIVDLAKQYLNKMDVGIYFEKIYKIHIYKNINDNNDIIDEAEYNVIVADWEAAQAEGGSTDIPDPSNYTIISNKVKMVISTDYLYLSDEDKAYYFGEFYFYYKEEDIVGNAVIDGLATTLDKYDYIEIDDGRYVKYTSSHVVNTENYTSYRNYKCVESYDSSQQYVTLLPLDSDMIINDKTDCYTERYIDANMKIVLSNGSVNDCRHKNSDESSIFDVDCDNMSAESVIYYAFMVSDDSSEGTPYPLNNAVSIGSIGGFEMPLSYINVGATNNIDNCKFSYNNTKWLFTTATQPTIASNGRMYLGDVRTTSELYSSSGSGNNVTFTGYSDTGSFILKTDKAKYASRTYSHRPYYIVAITSDNARAISPVYDFTYTEFVFEVGKLRELIDSTDDAGNPTTETSVRYGFTLSVREDGDKHYYFQNYEYTIQVFKKSENQYTSLGNVYHYPDNMSKYGTIIENEYVKNIVEEEGYGALALGWLYGQLEAQAKDITGLLHKNVLYDDTGFFDTYNVHDWVTINWMPNGGTWTYENSFTPRSYYGNDEIVSLIYDIGETYYLAGGGQGVHSFEQIVENVNEYGVKLRFRGWTTSPDGQYVYDSPGAQLTVNNPINYYASWGAAQDAITVLWDYNYPNGTLYHTDTVIPKGRLTCVDLPPKPVCNGYRFDGWKDVVNNVVVTSGCYEIDDTDNSVGSSVTLKGQWTQTSFFVNICLEVDGAWVDDSRNIALYDNGNMWLRFSCNGHNDDGYHILHNPNGGTVVSGNKMYFKEIISPIPNSNGQAGLNFKVHSLLFETKKFTNNANEVLYLYSIGRNGMSDTSAISTVNVNDNIERGEVYGFGGFPNTVNNTTGNWTNTYNGITDDYCGIIEYGETEEYNGDIYYKITLKNLYYNQ